MTIKLETLLRQRAELDEKIKKAKIAMARREGLIFDSVADLLRSEYPDRTVIEQDGIFYFDEVNNVARAPIPEHYDCLNCGIVKGPRKSQYYKSPPEDWQLLAGREGYEYYCRICDAYLGANWISMS